MTKLIENPLNNQSDERVSVGDVVNYIRTPPEIDKFPMSVVTPLIKYTTSLLASVVVSPQSPRPNNQFSPLVPFEMLCFRVGYSGSREDTPALQPQIVEEQLHQTQPTSVCYTYGKLFQVWFDIY